MNELVFIKKDKVVCSSLEVSKKFKKNHFHIIRDIETKIIGVADVTFTQSNFGLSEYTDNSGKTNKLYVMTRDGFSVLAMGFTGKRAMEWKIKYINAFNKMEQLLIEKQTKLWQDTRLESKINRLMETDEIKRLVEYAKEQGSKNADKYYITFSKLANKAVELESGQRNNATAKQLNNLILIENMINNVIKDGITKEIYYKEIYQDCKNRINSFLNVAYLMAV